MRLTIVLDLDDTLYLERFYVRSGIRAVSSWVEQRLGEPDFGIVAQRLWNAGVRLKLFDFALSRLGIQPEPGLIAKMVAIYRDHEPAIALSEDAELFLKAPPDCRFALVTDGHHVSQLRKITALGLRSFDVDPIICTDAWGRDYWKPHPRAFESVRTAHGRDGEFIYVADNPAKDFVAPRALGWRTVQIDRPGAVHPRIAQHAYHDADDRISSFDDLTPARIDRLIARVPQTGH